MLQVVNNYHLVSSQPSGVPLQSVNTCSPVHQPPIDKIIPGKVIEEEESSPEPPHRVECQVGAKGNGKAKERPAAEQPMKLPARGKALDFRYRRVDCDFFFVPATVDPASPANWVSEELVLNFPGNHFGRAVRTQYNCPEGHCLAAETYVRISWRCRSGKTIESDFLVFRSNSDAPKVVIGNRTLKDNQDEFPNDKTGQVEEKLDEVRLAMRERPRSRNTSSNPASAYGKSTHRISKYRPPR